MHMVTTCKQSEKKQEAFKYNIKCSPHDNGANTFFKLSLKGLCVFCVHEQCDVVYRLRFGLRFLRTLVRAFR